MKTPSPYLYDLVRTLTKSEKRYLSVQAGAGDKDYLQLLDALLAQQEFDEEQLVQDHAGANFLKHLPVNKQYLYDLLLRSLAQFGEKAIEDKIVARISAARVLVKKGLFSAAQRELKKGRQMAEKYEMYELQIMLCSAHKQLLSRQQIKEQDENVVHELYQLEMESLAQLRNTNAYWYLAQQMARFQMRFQKVQNETQQRHISLLTQSPEFNSLEQATNFKSRLYYYQANASYQFMLGDAKKAYEINRQFLDLLATKPHFLRLYAERYLATLNNMLIDSLVLQEYVALEEGINRLLKTLAQPEFKSIKNLAARVFRQRFLLLINWSLSQQDVTKAIAWIPEIKAGLDQFGKKIEKHYRITFYYLIAYLLFLNRRYDQALEWNNLILNDPKEDVVKEIFYFARMLNLLIHFELGNHSLLSSLLVSTPKYLKVRRALYTTEKNLLRLLGRLLNSMDKTEKKALFDQFEDDLDQLFQDPREKRIFNYLDLRWWLKNR